MVAQRTTLMTLSFFAILIGHNPPSLGTISLLWTGATVPFEDIRIGLIVILFIYVVSYVWKWLTENPQDFKRTANSINSLHKTFSGDFESWAKRQDEKNYLYMKNNTQLSKYLQELEKLMNEVKYTHVNVYESYKLRGSWSLWYHRIFTLIIPVAFPLLAILQLLNPGVKI